LKENDFLSRLILFIGAKKEQPSLFTDWKLIYPYCINTFVIKQKEPCKARFPSTTKLESEAKIPSRDSIGSKKNRQR
jgi:hypothetical protein